MIGELRRDEEPVAVPELLPVLPLRDAVVFPFMVVPLYVSRERSIRAIESALGEGCTLLLAAQKQQEQDDPGPADVHSVGTAAQVMRMLKLPDGRVRVLVQGLARARILSCEDAAGYLRARIETVAEPEPVPPGLEAEALLRSVRAALERSASLGKSISSEILVIAGNLEEPGRLADLAASNLDLKLEGAQGVLEALDPLERLRRVHELISRELEVLAMQQQIASRAKGEMDKSQREFFLRQQLKAIQSELGDAAEPSDELAQLRERLKQARLPRPVAEEAERQAKKLERMHPDSAETATLRNWLDVVAGLPWSRASRDNLDLARAQRVLDEDHHGLEKVKERIVEYLAVRKLRKSAKGPLLCFVGPPGVGKTSLGRSIARALGRKFLRLSLGGVRDEAEIRGHRRTYVGALPGRILQGLSQAGTRNPVFVLDEVDKIGQDFRGDPSAALLEVLDPEQNHTFRDHYLGVPFDLSHVLFLCTANLTDTIQPAFLDRMEVLRLSGYSEDEKLAIARRHLVPKQLREHGLGAPQLAFSDAALRRMVTHYTREAGLRNLEREIARVARKVARGLAEGRPQRMRVTPGMLARFLGPPREHHEGMLRRDAVGIATGLAWTAAGGDVLLVEATAMPGRGRLSLTGSLGEVMKESAQAALAFARSRAERYAIPRGYFGSHDVHVHLPEGAIPKDGPSAGVTLATAMLSAFTGRPVRRSLAMTGEVTLRGHVLPVGGLKEKLLAARRAGLREVALPRANRHELTEVPAALRRGLRIHLVGEVDEVLRLALRPRRA